LLRKELLIVTFLGLSMRRTTEAVKPLKEAREMEVWD
jgi:hypothetical protein